MSVHPDHLGACLYADEATFGEVSTTFDERLPVLNSIAEMVAGLEQTSQDLTRTVQYQNDGEHHVRMVQGGQFPIELLLTGHGSTCATTITASVLGTFLGRIIGNLKVDNEGGTVDSGATDADTFAMTGHTIATGSLVRIGTLNDGRGNGQLYRCGDTASPADPIVLNALSGTPNENDVVYVPELIYPSEAPDGGAITSLRFLLQTANQRYRCYGCYPTSIEFVDLSDGSIPRVRVMMAVSAWEAESASTWPTVTATDAFVAAPVAAGSVFINDVGTPTNQLIVPHEKTITIDFQTVPLRGPGAPRAYQDVIGVRRVKCQASISFVRDAQAAGTDAWGDWWNTHSPTPQHCMVTLSPGDGTSVGFYFPKLVRAMERPTQHGRDGLNAQRINYKAVTGPLLTNEITRANFMLALG